MIPSQFDYHAPATLAEAVTLLSRFGEGAKVLSGGQSLLPLLKLRLGSAEHLVDIGRIPGLEYIKEDGGTLKIGGRTRESALEQSELVRARVPILHDTVKVIADPLVRNLATVGGNLAHGDPGNDHPATMLVLGAQVVATGPSGERVIPIDRFFVGLFTTALQAGEILTEIRIPLPPARSGGAYVKLERKVGDYATAAENALINKRPSETAIAGAARLAGEACSPSADRRGSVEYKREMSRVLTARALKKAVERAGGQ